VKIPLLIAAGALWCSTSIAQRPDAFMPYKLVGGWQFQNEQTGVRYAGDIEVHVLSIDENGTMRGLISYDGRQSNDKCGTKALFTDVPVPAEIIKGDNEYRITFSTSCQVAPSPRTITWTLVCADDGVCSRPNVLPWGRGRTFLREQR
jgi:hypothetical protein